MNKVIVYQQADGTVAIACPVADPLQGESEAAYLERMTAMLVPEELRLSAVVVERGSIPEQHRGFRAAWRMEGGAIVVNMAEARTIKLAQIRARRDEMLSRLDIEYMRADEASDTAGKAAIAARKQVLRDLPKNVNLEQFTTPDDLAGFNPPELEG
jgi:hypothetical protein